MGSSNRVTSSSPCSIFYCYQLTVPSILICRQRKTCTDFVWAERIYKIEDPRFQTKSKILMKSGKLSSSFAKASDGQVGAAHFDFAQYEPPSFRIFAGGIPRRRRRRNAFGLIQEYCTRKEKSKSFGSPRGVYPPFRRTQRPTGIQFGSKHKLAVSHLGGKF